MTASVAGERQWSARALVGAHAGLFVMIMFWGSFFPVLERLLLTWDVLSATVARQVVGGVALFALMAAVEPLGSLRRLPLGRALLLGAIGIALGSMCITLAVHYSSGVSAAIVATTSPITAAIVARFVFAMPLARAMLTGAALAVVGGVIAVWAGGGGLKGFSGGEALVILANVCWTWFSVMAQRWLRGCSQVAIAAVTTATGALPLLVLLGLGAATGLHEARMDFSAETVLLMLYAGAIPIGLGNVLWHHGVSRTGVAIASMYNNLVPVSAVLVSLAAGIAPNPWQLVGGAVIIAGVLYAQLATRRPAAQVPAAQA